MNDPTPTNRELVGFRHDDNGEWIGELACGHHQHVRHSPPLQPNEWVLSDEGRHAKLGTTLRCRLCDQLLLPANLTYVRTSAVFDNASMPRALERSHRIGHTAWGVLKVHEGRLNFVADVHPPLDVVIEENATQAIPPDVAHEVHLSGPVRFSIDFYSITPYATFDATSSTTS